MSFIQIIEYKTTRIDELNAALDGWLEKTQDKRAATRGVQTTAQRLHDRPRPATSGLPHHGSIRGRWRNGTNPAGAAGPGPVR